MNSVGGSARAVTQGSSPLGGQELLNRRAASLVDGWCCFSLSGGKIHFGRTGETDSPRGTQCSQTQGWSRRAGHLVPSHLGALREASSERQGFRGPGSKQGQALLRAQISGWSVSVGLVPATSFLPTTQLTQARHFFQGGDQK